MTDKAQETVHLDAARQLEKAARLIRMGVKRHGGDWYHKELIAIHANIHAAQARLPK